MPTTKPLAITDLKILRGRVYATLHIAGTETTGTTLQVKLGASHKGLSEALEPLHALIKAAADRQLGEAVLDQAVSETRASTRQEMAGQVLAMVQRGTMPHELERALRPMAGGKR